MSLWQQHNGRLSKHRGLLQKSGKCYFCFVLFCFFVFRLFYFVLVFFLLQFDGFFFICVFGRAIFLRINGVNFSRNCGAASVGVLQVHLVFINGLIM